MYLLCLCVSCRFDFMNITMNINTTHSVNARQLRISSWNMRGITASEPYARKLLSENDICVFTEHHLFECELHKLHDLDKDYYVYAKSGVTLDNDKMYTGRGSGGVAIIWRKSIDTNVHRCPNLGDDRICVIKVTRDKQMPVFVVGVYLPQRDCRISNFDDYLYHLEYVIEKCQAEGVAIIIGDFNCHFGGESGPRAWGRTTRNACKLVGVIQRQNMYVVDLEPECSGPMHTYHVDGVGTSYIDHCLVSRRLKSLYVNCRILDDCVMNTSDHLVLHVSVNINIPRAKSARPVAIPRPSWKRFSDADILALYTEPVDLLMYQIYDVHVRSLVDSCNRGALVDDVLDAMCKCMLRASAVLLPVVKDDNCKKPYWTDVLSILSKAQKFAYRKWVEYDRPRNKDNIVWQRYKEAKRTFRTGQRNAESNYVRTCIHELCNAQQVDHKYFWYLVNKNKTRRSYVEATMDEDTGNILCDPNDVRDSWCTSC